MFFFDHSLPIHTTPPSLHDPLPISAAPLSRRHRRPPAAGAYTDGHEPARLHREQSLRDEAVRGRPAARAGPGGAVAVRCPRSEENTSELKSRQYIVCRLLLENKTN